MAIMIFLYTFGSMIITPLLVLEVMTDSKIDCEIEVSWKIAIN
jgi:hypothetical protein